MHSIFHSNPKDLSMQSIQLGPYQEVAIGYLLHENNSAKLHNKMKQINQPASLTKQ
jgi:hypothetical protein